MTVHEELLAQAVEMTRSETPERAFPLFYRAHYGAAGWLAESIEYAMERFEYSAKFETILFEAIRLFAPGDSSGDPCYRGASRIHILLDKAMAKTIASDERDQVRRVRIDCDLEQVAVWQGWDHNYARLLLIKALVLADQLDCPDKKLVKNIELKLLGLSRSLPILIENLENDEKVRHAAFTLGMKHHRYDVANIGFEHLIALYSHKMPQEVGRLHHEMSLGFKHLNNSARQSWVFLELFGEFSKQMRQFEYALQAFDRAIELLPRIKRQPLATQSRIASLLLRSAGCSLDLGWRNGARHRVEQVLALIVAHSQIFPVAENTIGTLRYALKIIDNSRDHSSSLSLLRDAGLFFEETAMLPSWRMKRNNPYYKAQSDKEDWMICAF